MTTPICTEKTMRVDPDPLDINRLDASVRCRPAEYVPEGLPAGTLPTGGRVNVSGLEGWDTHELKVRRYVGHQLVEFSPALSVAAGTDGPIDLPGDQLAGVDELHVGVDTPEAGTLLIGFELDFPAPQPAAASNARFG